MPKYTYECPDCNTDLTLEQPRFSSRNMDCPECSGTMHRVIKPFQAANMCDPDWKPDTRPMIGERTHQVLDENGNPYEFKRFSSNRAHTEHLHMEEMREILERKHQRRIEEGHTPEDSKQEFTARRSSEVKEEMENSPPPGEQ